VNSFFGCRQLKSHFFIFIAEKFLKIIILKEFLEIKELFANLLQMFKITTEAFIKVEVVTSLVTQPIDFQQYHK
jgi:hypothetical protein